MILDNLLSFSTNQTIAVGPSTVVATNDIDIGVGIQSQVVPPITSPAIPGVAAGAGARDLGIGDDPSLKLLVELTAAAASAGTTTIQVQLLGAPDSGTGTEGAFTIMAQSDVIGLVTGGVTQAAGSQGSHLFDIDVPRPKPGTPLPRYLRLQYVLTGTGTGGTISSYIVIDRNDQIFSAAGFQSGYVPGITIPN
jgi:hypothetical protein